MRPPTRPAALDRPLTTGPTIKRVTNWAKLGQFPSRIKLRKPRGPPLWADAVAKVDVDLAAATMETNKPLAPFENGGIGGALRRQGRQKGAARVPVMICTLATSTSLALVQAPTLAPVRTSGL